MSDVNLPSGQPNDDLVDQKKEKKDVVAYETYQKTLAQEKSAKAKIAELESELNSFKETQRQAEEAKLNEKGEFKKLVELREQEIAKLRQEIDNVAKERDNYKGDLSDTFKLQAFYDKLPGKIKRQEYLGFVDLNSIVVDPETNRIDESSVQSVVADFIEKYGDLVEQSKFGGLPSDAPRGTTRKYTRDEWKNLSLKDKKENWSRRPVI